MSTTYISQNSFYYDPIRQGYDTNYWKTLGGTILALGDGGLSAGGSDNFGDAIGLGDISKGDILFDVVIPSAPSTGSNREIGLWSPSKDASILFNIIQDSFYVSVSDGTVETTSDAIDWESEWTGARLTLRIRWDAGLVKFYINGVRRATLSGDNIPHGPLSLYFSDASDDNMVIKNIQVLGTYQYTLHDKSTDTGLYGALHAHESDSASVTESVSLSIS